ncbi:MAG: glycosyl transferase family 28 [Fibrobacteraceae bacterium]|nr:glycosyl transferase family 28 [Fibrobacteraceae bacterium]
MKVLVAPLDWGLGHATRCVPIIRRFLAQGAQVELAVCGQIARLYREIFPELRQRLAPSYNIVYPKHGFDMALWLLRNRAHLNAVIKFEHRFAEEMVERHHYDVLISDNRFGFYSKGAKSVYMTHQCRIAFPPALSMLEPLGEFWHWSMMKHFNQVWVPDFPEFPGYAGLMSHPSFIHSSRVKFVGLLSRFDADFFGGQGSQVCSKPCKYKTMSIVSGVEPARTTFENKLRKVLSRIPGKHLLVLGKVSEGVKVWREGNLEIHTHLPQDQMAAAAQSSQWIISRGGYSTIMDMAVLGAKCIFVPTPGQYEQVVLARSLDKAGYGVHVPDDKFDEENLEKAFTQNVVLPKPPKEDLLKLAIGLL